MCGAVQSGRRSPTRSGDHVPVTIDYEAEGLLDDIGPGPARDARLELLRTLEQEGFSPEELRRAARDDRLALLPVERVLEAEGPRHTLREVAEATELGLEFLQDARRAIGDPVVDPDERVLTDEELELARHAKVLLDAGLDRESFLELVRVMSHALDSIASTLVATLGQALLKPGDTERDLGLRYAESLRMLAPLAGPALELILGRRVREQIREAVIGRAELESGRLPGAQPIVVAFVDIVGFTELGEQVAPDELGPVIRDFEQRVEAAARPPVRLVKTIGDAAMLVAPEPDPLLDAVLGLVEALRDDPDAPVLRAGVASGEALQRAGDWYGRPVNLASRLTAFARRGSVVATAEVRDASGKERRWSFAGNRRLKGVVGEVAVYRVRPAERAD
jgi:adenylate cyclase